MSRLRSFARASARCAATLALSVACLSLLGGGTCIWVDDDDSRCYDDDAGNDAGCDDDFDATTGDDLLPGGDEIRRQLDGLPATGGSPGRSPWMLGGQAAALAASVDREAYRLGDVRIEPATDARRHPDARLLVPAGPALTELWRLGVWSAPDLTVFAEQIRLANDDLLGLPPWAGQLQHAGTYVLDTVVAVVYQQVPPWGGPPLADARQVLVFDGLGRVVQVENETIVPPGVATPAPDRWQLR